MELDTIRIARGQARQESMAIKSLSLFAEYGNNYWYQYYRPSPRDVEILLNKMRDWRAEARHLRPHARALEDLIIWYGKRDASRPKLYCRRRLVPLVRLLVSE